MPNMNRAGERNLAKTEGWPWEARLPFMQAAHDDWVVFYAHVKAKEKHVARVRAQRRKSAFSKGIEISKEKRRNIVLLEE